MPKAPVCLCGRISDQPRVGRLAGGLRESCGHGTAAAGHTERPSSAPPDLPGGVPQPAIRAPPAARAPPGTWYPRNLSLPSKTLGVRPPCARIVSLPEATSSIFLRLSCLFFFFFKPPREVEDAS